MNTVKTNPLYWSCECKENYIHSKSENLCKLCGAKKENQPDSRSDEVKIYHIKKRIEMKKDTIKTFEYCIKTTMRSNNSDQQKKNEIDELHAACDLIMQDIQELEEQIKETA